MQAIAIILILLAGMVVGVVGLLGYMVHRMMSNEGWDDSNITNALRLLSHVVMHPQEFERMFYIDKDQWEAIAGYSPILASSLRRPFWYVDKDELSEVVDTRAPR